MRGICDRLRFLRERSYGKRGKARFSKDLGIGPSTYDRYERDRVPPADILVLASRITHTRLDWLLTGEGPVDAAPVDESPRITNVMDQLRVLLHRRPELTDSVESFVEALSGSTQPHVRSSESDNYSRDDLIPLVGSTAAGMARFWEELDSSDIGAEADAQLENVLSDYAKQTTATPGSIRASGTAYTRSVSLVQLSQPGDGGFLEFLKGTTVRAHHPDAVAWRIDGDSMSPRYEDGDIVITSASEPAVAGHPCVARQRGQIGVNCKLFQVREPEVSLIPVNERYPIQQFPADQLMWAHRVLFSVHLQ